MIRIKLVENDNKIENPIVGATLLKKEEYEKYKDNIPIIDWWWWLRSVGDYEEYVCDVDRTGNVYSHCYVNSTAIGVRPALILNPQSFNFEIGDKFGFGKHSFTVISNELAICKDFIGKGCFREDWEAEDASDYEKSDVKRTVDDWFNNAIKKEPNFFNKKNIDFMLQNDNPELKAQLLQINHDLGQDNRADMLQKEIDDLFGDL